MYHSFDTELAEKYGILEAILLNHLLFWIEKNKANEMNFHDGYFWTYNSTKAFSKLFPYASQRQIQNALKHLKEERIIQTGNYNTIAYDRTLWYAFTDLGESIMQKCKMENVSLSNGFTEEGKPIPNKNTNNKPNNKPNNKYKVQIEDICSYLNKKAHTNYRAVGAETVKHITARLEEGFTVEDFKAVIDKKSAEWLGDEKMQQYLRPQTLFGSKFESYLNQHQSKKSEKEPDPFETYKSTMSAEEKAIWGITG